ncbi:MAG: hypothetical protein RL071_2234 [Pseudomonadota bacterium]|jgi:hypothetical protein
MTAPARWSAPALSLAPLDGAPDAETAPAVFTATCWCGGLIDTERFDGGDVGPGQGVEAAALRRWLAERSAELALELRVTAGGGREARGWLGLSARGATEAAALAALQRAADDLGEALDVWEWWPTAEAPPPLPPLQLCLRAEGAGHALHLRGADGPPRWIEGLLQLSPARLPERTVRIQLRSLAASPDLRRALHAAAAEAAQAIDEPWELLMASEGGTFHRLRQMHEQTQQAELWFSLHGERPLGAVLAEGLLHRFTEPLGGALLRLLPGPPAAVRVDAEVLEWTLQLLRLGAPGSDDEPSLPPTRALGDLQPPSFPPSFLSRR